jgi:hypothetical protein
VVTTGRATPEANVTRIMRLCLASCHPCAFTAFVNNVFKTVTLLMNNSLKVHQNSLPGL